MSDSTIENSEKTPTLLQISTKKRVRLLDALPLLLVFQGTGESVRSNGILNVRSGQGENPSEDHYTIILPDTISYTLRSSKLLGLSGTTS
jgi:hypothetical protein